MTRVTSVTAIDLTPVAFTVSRPASRLGIYRYRLFGLVPVARDMVIDSMEDGVLVARRAAAHLRSERRGEKYTA